MAERTKFGRISKFSHLTRRLIQLSFLTSVFHQKFQDSYHIHSISHSAIQKTSGLYYENALLGTFWY